MILLNKASRRLNHIILLKNQCFNTAIKKDNPVQNTESKKQLLNTIFMCLPSNKIYLIILLQRNVAFIVLGMDRI